MVQVVMVRDSVDEDTGSNGDNEEGLRGEEESVAATMRTATTTIFLERNTGLYPINRSIGGGDGGLDARNR